MMTPEALKERYDFDCCKCGHSMQFTPSILMHSGHNSGHGRCSKCDSFLHLEIDDQNERGISILWDGYISTISGVTMLEPEREKEIRDRENLAVAVEALDEIVSKEKIYTEGCECDETAQRALFKILGHAPVFLNVNIVGVTKEK